MALRVDDGQQRAYFDPKMGRNADWGYAGNSFQSHWKDGGSAPGHTVVITGFGGWPVPFAPVGLGAGAMVNAVFSCKGRVGDPLARAKARARKLLEEQGQIAPRARGSQLAQKLGWAPSRKKRKKKVGLQSSPPPTVESDAVI